MIEEISAIAGAVGLSTSAGLNAYLPLFIVGLAARFTHLIRLNEPWNVLTQDWVLVLLAILLLIEIVIDKIPGADTLNDIFQTASRPLAGAILFAGSSGIAGQVHPLVALVAGLLIAGSVHTAKMTIRPIVTVVTAGIGNWFVSILEDAVSLTLAVLAILVPLAALAVVIVIAVICIAGLNSLRAAA